MSTFDQVCIDHRELSDEPQTCITCQSDLRQHEALQCDDCIGDELAKQPCCFCGEPVKDRQPVEIAAGYVCAEHYRTRVLRIE